MLNISFNKIGMKKQTFYNSIAQMQLVLVDICPVYMVPLQILCHAAQANVNLRRINQVCFHDEMTKNVSRVGLSLSLTNSLKHISVTF